MNRAIIFLSLFMAVSGGRASLPDQERPFQQTLAYQKVVVCHCGNLKHDILARDRVDVFVIERRNGKWVGATIAKNVLVVGLDSSNKAATLHVERKDVPILIEANRRGAIFLVPHRP